MHCIARRQKQQISNGKYKEKIFFKFKLIDQQINKYLMLINEQLKPLSKS